MLQCLGSFCLAACRTLGIEAKIWLGEGRFHRFGSFPRSSVETQFLAAPAACCASGTTQERLGLHFPACAWERLDRLTRHAYV